MAKRPKLAEPEPTFEESLKEVATGLEEMGLMCEQLNLTYDISSLSQLLSVVSEIKNVDEFMGELKASRDVVAKQMKLAADAAVKLEDVLHVFFLTYDEEEED